MSKGISPGEFKSLVDRSTATFSPVAHRALEAWNADVLDAYSRLHYLTLTRVESGIHLDRMLTYRAVLTNQMGVLDGVKADVEKIWNTDLSVGTSAYHTIEPRDNGFEFRFISMNGSNEYVTGRLVFAERPREQ